MQYLKHPGAGAQTGQQTGVKWTGYRSCIAWTIRQCYHINTLCMGKIKGAQDCNRTHKYGSNLAKGLTLFHESLE